MHRFTRIAGFASLLSCLHAEDDRDPSDSQGCRSVAQSDTPGTSTSTSNSTTSSFSTSQTAAPGDDSSTSSDLSTTTTSGTTPTTTPIGCNYNGTCEEANDETVDTCPHDCVACTLNGVCDDYETPLKCPDDCQVDCQLDGDLDPTTEACDDGADSPTCDMDCTPPVCGDAHLNVAAGEECDDGNVDDGDGCSATCGFERLVFVTSTTYYPSLGGLGGADAKCQSRAYAADLSGTFMAWLSDSTSDPKTRFGIAPTSPAPYRRTDGVLIATSWSDLTDGSLLAPINLDEFGAPVELPKSAWTSTNADGTRRERASCNDWTSSSPAASGFTGKPEATDTEWTLYLNGVLIPCDTAHRLYCVRVSPF